MHKNSTSAQKPYSGGSRGQNYMIKPKEPEPDDGETGQKTFFFIPLVHWTSKIQILVVRKLISLVQKNLLK